MSVEIIITDQIVEINEVSNPVEISVSAGAAVAPVWGNITGTLSNQTDLQNALNLKVPYTGATANVDLGEFELKAGQIEYDQTPTGVAGVAVTRWNDSTGTIETTLKGGSVVLEHGRDMFERVVNKTGIQLTKAAYQAVRVSNAQGQRLAVQLAQANNDNNSADTIGLVVETIDNNQEGYIYTVGEIDGVNTTGSLQGETWVDGDVLYLSPTTAGRITNIKPLAPQHLVVIGYVVYAHQNNGKIYIKITNGFELGELHDVSTIGATNGQVLKYNGTIWTPSGDVGITSLNGLTATTQTFSLDTRGTDVAIVSSGSNHEFIFPSASATRRGVLTSADWLLFFNKIGGSGTIGTMPIFTGTGAIGNSIVNITNGLVNIDGVGNLSDYALQIGTGRTNNGFAYIDLVGDATYSDYGFRLMRNNTGANATSVIEHRGTGDFIFKTVDNANLYLQTGSTNRVFIEANSGALNVANTSAVFLANTGEQLIVNGSAKFASSVTANSLVKTGGTSSQYLMADGSTSTLTNPVTGTGVSGQVSYWSGTNTQTGSNNLFWDNANGRLGIGTNAPSGRLHALYSNFADVAIFERTPIFTNALAASSILRSGYGVSPSTGAGPSFAFQLRVGAVVTDIASFGGARDGADNSGYLSFATVNAGTQADKMQIRANGNVLIQNGGTFTDSGQRLQVIGDTLLKGSGNTSATTALTIQNSSSQNSLRVRNDGNILLGNNGLPIWAFTYSSVYDTIDINGTNLSIYPLSGSISLGGATQTPTTGSANNVITKGRFQPASGTATFTEIRSEALINQTGGANGITRGLYVNPTLTAAADWRSIEWSNNTGWGLYGAGTSNNYLAGSLGIGTTALTATSLSVSKSITGATSYSGIVNNGQVLSDVTNSVVLYRSTLNAASVIFTIGNVYHNLVEEGTIGGAVTIANHYGYSVNSNLRGTNVFGFHSNIGLATGKWNLYMAGAASNYLAGSLMIGSSATPAARLLEIQSATGGEQILARFRSFGASSNVGIEFLTSATTVGQIIGLNAFLGLATAGLAFRYGTTEGMRLTGLGNLHIGTFVSDSGEKLQVNGTMKVTGAAEFGGNVTLLDADNIIIGTTTGTKIGTATSQKIGFWNATPIVQPTTAVASATRVGGAGNTVTDTDTYDGYTIPQIVKALRNAGLLA